MPRLSLAALLLAGTALPALAAAPLPANEEIIVTAPLEGALIESLQGATVLRRDAIVTRLSTSLGELLSGLPGISSTFFGAGAGRPIIRGLGEDRIRVLENGIGTISQNFLEMSNVNVIDEMVRMIVGQRAYEINSKAIQTADAMLGIISALKRS